VVGEEPLSECRYKSWNTKSRELGFCAVLGDGGEREVRIERLVSR
jgi:hypothetical protein